MKPSIEASFSTDNVAPGGGPNGAPSANAEALLKIAASSAGRITKMRVMWRNVIALSRGDPDDGCRLRQSGAQGTCEPGNPRIPGSMRRLASGAFAPPVGIAPE